VVTGAGLAGAAEIAATEWIEVHSLKDTARLAGTQQELGLGIGEVSAILLVIEPGRLGKRESIPLAASESLKRASG